MKVIDWLSNDDYWKSGVVLRNSGHVAETVGVMFAQYQFPPSGIEYHDVPPWGCKILGTEHLSTGSMVIHSTDHIEVIATTRNIGGGYSFVPVRAAKRLCDVLPPTNELSQWRPGPFWTLLPGGSGCTFLKRAQMAVIQFSAMQTFYAFPNRSDRLLGVMDACPAFGECEGHPENSHSSTHYLGQDLSYFTFERNNTQWGSAVPIMTDGRVTNLFDAERNKFFFSLIKKYIPDTVIMCDRRLVAAMKADFIQADPEGLYNHDKHAHIHLGERINWKAEI